MRYWFNSVSSAVVSIERKGKGDSCESHSDLSKQNFDDQPTTPSSHETFRTFVSTKPCNFPIIRENSMIIMITTVGDLAVSIRTPPSPTPGCTETRCYGCVYQLTSTCPTGGRCLPCRENTSHIRTRPSMHPKKRLPYINIHRSNRCITVCFGDGSSCAARCFLNIKHLKIAGNNRRCCV